MAENRGNSAAALRYCFLLVIFLDSILICFLIFHFGNLDSPLDLMLQKWYFFTLISAFEKSISHIDFWAPSIQDLDSNQYAMLRALYGNLREKCQKERRHTLCASLRSRNACQDFTRATLCRNLQENCRRQKWVQNADTHFARACAVETHVKTSKEPLFAEIYRKNAAPKNADTHFGQACAVETHVKISQEPLHAEIYW